MTHVEASPHDQSAQSTAGKIRAAMARIEYEIANGNGIYSVGDGRVSLQEVIRRAGFKSPALLEKQRHRALKQEVQRWLKRLGSASSVSKWPRLLLLQDRLQKATDDLQALMQDRAEAELEIIHLSELIQKKDEQILKLERELSSLQRCKCSS
ncbi:hypothetical protein [Microvirga sp. TS319]|uniref:hypothetical protein n=1 Tax=Microvirga sp. TS319 TaxID=3241165 RepID=UPI00351A6368